MKDFSGIATLLGRMNMFSGMTAREVETVLVDSGAIFREYEKNSIILRQGDEYGRLAIVLEGSCTSEMNDHSGQTLSLGRFKAPFPVAPGFLFLENGRLPVSLRALTSAKVLFIAREGLFHHLQNNRALLRDFLRLLSNRIEYLTERVSFHSCRTIREKLLLYLETIKTEGNDSVTIPLSVEELARYFGVARPSLSQVISDLEREGVIKKMGRTIRFLS